MATPRILLLVGSTAAGSPENRLAATIAREIAYLDVITTLVMLEDHPLPLCDPDLPAILPLPASRFRKLVAHHDALAVVTGAGIGSLPTPLKNALDWLVVPSDGAAVPIRRLPVAAAAIAESLPAGRIALDHLRSILRHGLAAPLLERELLLGADAAFDAGDRLVEPRHEAAVRQFAHDLVEAGGVLAVDR